MIRRLLVVLLSGVGVASTAVALLTRIPERQNGLLIFIASFLPWLSVLSFACLVCAALLRSRSATLLTAASTCLLATLFAPLFLPGAGQTANGAPRLRVMSYSAWAANRDVDADAMARMLLAQRPDVVALQELDLVSFLRLLNAVKKREPSAQWQSVSDLRTGQAIFSRYPIALVGTEREHTRLLRARVQTNAGPIAVWNIHAFRPDFTQSGLSFLAYGGGSAPQPQTRAQIDWLAREANQEILPLVLLGDFNFPYRSPDHDLLSQTLRDAHWEAGQAFGFSFPASDGHARRLNAFGQVVTLASPFRLTKIDHIFVNRQLRIVEAYTVTDSVGSDHAPVVAELE